MARELPGFYFDTEKNRYFPIPRNGAAAGRGIPADGKRPQVTPESDRDGRASQEVKPTLPPSQFSLLQRRERSGAFLYGKDAPHGRRFTSASWEAGFRDFTVWGFGNDPHFGASADSSLHGAGPFLHLSHGSRTILLAGDEHGLNALEPRSASGDPLSIHGVKLFDSRPSGFPAESENSVDTTAIDSGAPGREDNTASRQEEESSSEGSSSDDDLNRKRGFYFRGRRRKPWFQRKRKRKARGVWRDSGQGLQRIDIPPPSEEGHVEEQGAREESSKQAGRKERCPVDLALLSSLPLQSRVTTLRSAGRAEEWGGDQRFIATTLGSNTTAGSFLLLRSREGDTWTEPDVVRRHYFDKESIWTGDISSNGRQAVIGASTLGFRIQLETWAIRPLASSNGSATLAQQFDSTGNLVLSGFRNGAISTVDLRAPPPQLRPLDGLSKPQRGVKVASHGTPLRMRSSVCDLRLLRTDENFLLASAMDGSLVQWDRRAARRPVRTFPGHRNSHTMLKMAVDPGESVVMSGGEDCVVRIWSLSSGGLLQHMGPFETPVTYLDWVPSDSALEEGRTCMSKDNFPDLLSWGVWMGAQGSSTGPMLATHSRDLRTK